MAGEGGAPAAPGPGSLVPVVNPSGALVQIPAESYDNAVQFQGYQAPSADQLAAIAKAQKYEGPLEGLKAFGEGAASALTFGLAPKLEEALGVEPEDIAGRKEAHPVAHLAGEVTGVAAPLILTAGASAPVSAAAGAAETAGAAARAAPGIMQALRSGAEFTAPGLIARAGQAVRGAAEAAELPGVLGRFAPVAAQGAIEGGLYAGADVAERAALKDPALTAESAALELGVGSLFGGTLMAGGKLAAEGFSALLGKASRGLESLGERFATGDKATVKLMMESRGTLGTLEDAAPGAVEQLQASSPETAKWIISNAKEIAKREQEFPGLTKLLTRADPDTAQLVLDNWGSLLKDPQRRIEIGTAMQDAAQNAYTSITGALRTINTEVRPAEIEGLLSGAGVAPEVAQRAGQKILSRVDDAISKMKAEPDLFDAAYRRQLELYRDGLARDLGVRAPAPVSTGAPAETWKEFVASKMGEYMKSEGGHGPAMARLGAEWKALKAGVPPAAAPVAETVATAAPAATPADIFQRLRELRMQLDGSIPWQRDLKGLAERNAVSQFKSLRAAVKGALTDEGIWGEAGARQGSYDSALSSFFDARKAFEKSLMDGPAGAKVVSPSKINSWLNLAADLRGKAKNTAFDEFLGAGRGFAAEMEKAGYEGAGAVRQAVDQAAQQAEMMRQKAVVTQIVKMLQGPQIISSGPAIPGIGYDLATEALQRLANKALPFGLTGMVTGTIDRLRSPGVTIGVLRALDTMAAKTSKAIGSGVGRIFEGEAAAASGSAARAVTPESYPNVSADLHHYGSDLDRLAETVSQHTAPVAGHAPATTDALQALAARVVQHLEGLIPAGPARLPLSPEHRPSVAELTPFNRAHEIAENPLRLLDHVARGTLDPGHVRAAEAIWPKLTQEMRTQVLEKLAAQTAAGKTVPRRSRLALSIFLGTDLDRSTTQATIAANQAALASAPKPTTPGAVSGPVGGKGGGKASALKSVGKFATAAQRSQEEHA